MATTSTMIVVTTNDLPGYRVEEILGMVTGITVRSRHFGAQVVAGLKSIIGGELLVRTAPPLPNRVPRAC